MTPETIIIDSSVVLKWYLPDEEDEHALFVQESFRNKFIQIAVPLLFFYEVGNVLRTTAKSLRIEPRKAIKAYNNLLALDFLVYSSTKLFEDALNKALVLDISHYDASYIALAEYLGKTFYTADKKLTEKVDFEYVKILTEYQPAS